MSLKISASSTEMSSRYFANEALLLPIKYFFTPFLPRMLVIDPAWFFGCQLFCTVLVIAILLLLALAWRAQIRRGTMVCMQNKAKSEENERSDTKGFSSSVNKITTKITSSNMFVANGSACRTTHSTILSEIWTPSLCWTSVCEAKCLQFSYLEVILQPAVSSQPEGHTHRVHFSAMV